MQPEISSGGTKILASGLVFSFEAAPIYFRFDHYNISVSIGLGDQNSRYSAVSIQSDYDARLIRVTFDTQGRGGDYRTAEPLLIGSVWPVLVGNWPRHDLYLHFHAEGLHGVEARDFRLEYTFYVRQS